MNDQWIRRILEWEQANGYANFGFTNTAALKGNKPPKNIDDAVALYKKLYLPMVDDLPEGLQPVAGDFAFNSEDPRASLMVAAGIITPQEKVAMYKGGSLDKAAVDKAWNGGGKKAVESQYNANPSQFLDAFDSERIRSYSNTNNAAQFLPEWTQRVKDSRAISNDILGVDATEQTAPATQQQTTSPAAQQAALQSLTTPQTPPQTEDNMTTTNPREEFPESVNKYFERYFDLYVKANFSETADERATATDELTTLREEIDNQDLIAQLDRFSTEKALESGVFDEAGRLALESKKEQYDSAIKGMADDFALNLINLGVSGAQVAKGLSDLRDLEMPAMPALPQDTPELTQAFGEAQREAQMIDPRLNEARKRAALMTLNQFEEISKTASAGQAGAYGANMQQTVNRVADEMRKGAYEDQLLKQRAQAMYYNLANQKAAEDQFQYGAAMGQFDRRYGEFNVQRAAANTLAQTGFTNLFNTLNQAQGDVNLAQRYKSIRDTFQGRLDDIDAEAQRKMQPNLTTDPNIMAPPPEPEMYVPYTMQPLPKQGSSAFTPRQEPTQLHILVQPPSPSLLPPRSN